MADKKVFPGRITSYNVCYTKLLRYAVKHGIDIKVIGIPKTVDNDLVGTDHCPGFGSAAKYLNTTLQVSAYDCYSYSTPTIIMMETMGRHAGWLAASTACAKYNGEQLVDRIYLPEAVFDMDDFLADTEKLFKEKQMVFLTVSEGIKDVITSYSIHYTKLYEYLQKPKAAMTFWLTFKAADTLDKPEL